MLCYISQPNGQWLEINIEPKQTAQVILDKVLEKLGILEVDYFGLQYKGPKGEELWLNLRNRVCDHEILGPSHVYRLSLRVKFFVPPHLVQQECTKELFYTQAKDAMSKGLVSLMMPDCDEAKLAKIVASITQADYGDQTCNSYQTTVYSEILAQICPHLESSQSLISKIHLEHSKLHGVPRASARYFMLQDVSSLPGYGVEEHKAVNAQGVDINFRVGPEGIVLHASRSKAERKIPYTQIRLATHNDKVVHIELIDDAGEPQGQECFKLISRKAAVALYRCITEMHSFYRCDTVCANVQSQYSRDFKGTFVSIFNENSELGKRYIFDIQRTSQEAYDWVRRQLYAKSTSQGSPIHCLHNSLPIAHHEENNNDIKETEEEEEEEEASKEASSSQSSKSLQKEVKQLKRRLESIEDSLLCCICMYQKVCVVLCPCGHMTCDTCAEHIENCPQCRTPIERYQKVFHGFGLDSNKICKEEEQMV